MLFLLFFLSGACGLTYQVIWTRMAFASFGVITPVLSVVISVFMLGLGLGSWAGGRWIQWLSGKTGLSPVVFYALAEFGIGAGAFIVPVLFKTGESWLLAAGQADSGTYLLFSALVLSGSLLPWCILMGTTFPFMMAFLMREEEGASRESFSYLYVANVLGAMAGAVGTAVIFIELFGFRDTLWIAAAANFLVAMIALLLATRRVNAEGRSPGTSNSPDTSRSAGLQTADFELAPRPSGLWIRAVLFTTGLASMGMEVIWTRAFAPVLKTQVYSFSMIVAAYLAATFAGSLWYRSDYRRNRVWNSVQLLAWLSIAALMPVLVNDTRFVTALYWDPKPHLPSAILLLASVVPFCALLGYLTPSLIDSHSAGEPRVAGTAYAINVLGCIVGPLIASYLLLPFVSERVGLVLFSLPFFAFFLSGAKTLPRTVLSRVAPAAAIVLAIACFWSKPFEDTIRQPANRAVVRRDHAASVVAFSSGPGDKSLLVNGFGMTKLTPITKFMTHLPLAFLPEPPESALVVCFGMGTSYRSALSWDIKTTAVELVPGVVEVFDYFHRDGPQVRANPKGEIVIDDGRRFLARTREVFDTIIIDPPPPVESAGSSLLYSREFYLLASKRLSDGGIVQAWVPEDIMGVEPAALRSVCDVFPYVRCFRSVAGWGLHILASNQPIAGDLTTLMAHMPAAAKADLVEWDPDHSAEEYMAAVLAREVPVQEVLAKNPGARITDDEPYNEYYLVREWLRGGQTPGK